MYPKLFQIGPVPIYSYGLMLGVAFLIGSMLFSKELKRNKYDENVGVLITFFSLIGGIIGAKIFFILEDWNFGKGTAISSLLTTESIFSASGLTFYGGLIVSILMITFYCKTKKLSILRIFDLMSPAATIGYGIARIGCHLAGDGDYGIEIARGTFWEFIGYSYSKGTVPTVAGVIVHPTPLYEFGAAVIIFLFLWFYRKKIKYTGQLFSYYMILNGVSRLLVEIIRTNPKIFWELTQAQIVSILMIIFGIYLIFRNRKKGIYR